MNEFSDVPGEYINEQYTQISNNVKRLRLSKEYTQEYVALSMGFTTATFYANAESLKRDKRFSLEHLIKISKILDVKMEEFFKDIQTTS